MSDQFLGEIRIFAGNFAIFGWALCNGQLLPISQNTALFSLLGTNFGGNGTSTFALPNFQGNMPMHWGNGAGLTPRVVGETGGEDNITVLSTEMPLHNHALNCYDSGGSQDTASGATWAREGASRGKDLYVSAVGSNPVNVQFPLIGGNLPHNNMQPYLTLTFIIAMTGIYPARN